MFGNLARWCEDYNTQFYAKQAARREKREQIATAWRQAQTVQVVSPSAPSAPSVVKIAPSAPKNWVLPSSVVSPWYKDILENATHLMVAGATGSGKSVVLNGILHTALALYTPEDLGLVLIDPKEIELIGYSNLPHTMEFETEPEDILALLNNLYEIMTERYTEMKEKRIKKYTGKKILVVVDELADLLYNKKYGAEIKMSLTRLLAKARAANITIICATQAPNRTTLSADLVLNITNRIALNCKSAIESKQIVGVKGAESLPWHGSCLYDAPGQGVKRIDGIPFYSDDELNERIDFWEDQWEEVE